MRSALIVAIAIGVCGVKEESASKDSEAPAQAAPVEAPAEAKRADAPKGKRAPAGDLELAGFDAALGRAIVEVEEDRYRVDPFVATLVAEHLSQTGGEPAFVRVPRKQIKAGAPNGYRVGKLEKGSLFHRLGLRAGDVVTKVGNAAPPVPKKLRELLETVEPEVAVELTRDGSAMTLRYELTGEQSWHDYLAKTAGRKFEEEEKEEPETPEQHAASGSGKPSSGGGGSSSGSGSSGSGSSGSSSGGKPTGGGGSSSTTPENIPVSCSSSSSCTVAKWYFDKIVSSSSQMRSQAKISSASTGYKLAWVKPGSGVHKLLFRSGDIITRVNGRSLTNQLEALTLYAGLKSTRTYKVNYTRGGKSLSKTIRIV
jgi:type II secretory pathway component PulC